MVWAIELHCCILWIMIKYIEHQWNNADYIKKGYKAMNKNQNTSIQIMLKDKIKKQKLGEPIIVKDVQRQIAKASGMDVDQVNRGVIAGMRFFLRDKDIKLKRFQRGVYYRYCKGVFGDTVIDKERLIYKKYLGNFKGYETGPKLLLGLGLTTHLTNLPRKFVSNAARNRSFKDNELNIDITRPRTVLNKKNLRYFQLLDTILMVKLIPVDAKDPIEIYLKFIKTYKLTLTAIELLANTYYKNEKYLFTILERIKERHGVNAIT